MPINLPHMATFPPLPKKPIENIAGKGNCWTRMFSIFQNVFYPAIEKLHHLTHAEIVGKRHTIIYLRNI